LTSLDAVSIGWVDNQLGPSVGLTTVNSDQQDAQLSVAYPVHITTHVN